MTRLAALASACALIAAGCGSSHHAAKAVPSLHGGRSHSLAFLNGAQRPVGLSYPSFPAATPQLSGYDAVTASYIPYGAQVALCYVNGAYANCGAVSARHPKHLVTIAVNTGGVARLLDVEPGDATPAQAGGWVRAMVDRHIYRPGIYANASTMPAVEQSLAGWHLARSQYVLMVAAWDGNPAIPSGFDAKQWKSIPALDWDSFAASFFAKPKPAPRPVRCYHHGWAQPRTRANEALCNRVRAHDSYLGQVVRTQDGYLAVTNRNLAATRRQIAALQARENTQAGRQATETRARDTAYGQLQADLKKYGFTG